MSAISVVCITLASCSIRPAVPLSPKGQTTGCDSWTPPPSFSATRRGSTLPTKRGSFWRTSIAPLWTVHSKTGMPRAPRGCLVRLVDADKAQSTQWRTQPGLLIAYMHVYVPVPSIRTHACTCRRGPAIHELLCRRPSWCASEKGRFDNAFLCSGAHRAWVAAVYLLQISCSGVWAASLAF
eukprot:COSAG06_NODE_478_length_15216_cov_101.587286_7_plen_181_part_00